MIPPRRGAAQLFSRTAEFGVLAAARRAMSLAEDDGRATPPGEVSSTNKAARQPKEYVMRWILGAVLGALLSLYVAAPAQASPPPPLPADIKMDIHKRFPGSQVVTFWQEPKKHYEVRLKFKSGFQMDVIYRTLPGGHHAFSAEEIVVNSLPVQVVNGLEAKYPGAIILKAERVLNAKHQTILYQLAVKWKGKSFEAHVTPAGVLVNEFNVIAQGPATPRAEEVAVVLAGGGRGAVVVGAAA
jgi:hypothetical protein